MNLPLSGRMRVSDSVSDRGCQTASALCTSGIGGGFGGENGGRERSGWEIVWVVWSIVQLATVPVEPSRASCTFEIEQPADDGTFDPHQVKVYPVDEEVPHDLGCDEDTGWSWASAEHSAIRLC